MTCQKGANLLHYYVSKQVFSWRAKKVQICCLITWKSKFSHDAPKTLIFDALLRGKAGLLMSRQTGANLLQYYISKQVFSWHTKNSYIWCIISLKSRFSHDVPKKCNFFCIFTFRSRFSHNATVNKVYIWCIITFRSRFPHDAPNTLIFDALLRGKAGFLMKHKKGANLMHYYVEQQVFSWCAKKVQICCIIT